MLLVCYIAAEEVGLEAVVDVKAVDAGRLLPSVEGVPPFVRMESAESV